MVKVSTFPSIFQIFLSVYCLDDLIHYLHWMAFDNYVVSTPPISNPYLTVCNAILDMKAGAKKLRPRKKKKVSLTSTLPLDIQASINKSPSSDSTTDGTTTDGSVEEAGAINSSEEDEETEDSLSIDELIARVPSQVLLDASGDITIPPKYISDESNPVAQDSDTNIPDLRVHWADRPDIFLLRQLPQPGYLYGKGVKTIDAGFDHLACLTYDGNLCENSTFIEIF